MDKKQRIIFNIQKFSLNDGPGIRTTVFMKGCMLRCIWCHNPESKSPKQQLMLYSSRCIGCRACEKVCPRGFHHFDENGVHLIDRSGCSVCGTCADACVGALEIVGKPMNAEEIVQAVLRDKAFYDNSGGGMTLSGGEPLLTPDITLEVLRLAKEKGLHNCIETCGYAAWEDIEALLPYVDLFLWDFKESDDARHIEYTGVSNKRILENLRRLNDAGAKIILRCPIIPGCNDRKDHLLAIAALAEELDGVQRVDVEPYHPLGQSKSEGIGEEYVLSDLGMTDAEKTAEWISVIASATSKPVQKA